MNIAILLISTNAPINLLAFKYREIIKEENEIVQKDESIVYKLEVIPDEWITKKFVSML
jgi:hypothetical protein